MKKSLKLVAGLATTTSLAVATTPVFALTAAETTQINDAFSAAGTDTSTIIVGAIIGLLAMIGANWGWSAIKSKKNG